MQFGQFPRSSALLSGDGNITGMSDISQKYPFADAKAYEARVHIPLSESQLALARQAFSDGGEVATVSGVLRSALAQLSFDACHPERTELSLVSDGVEMTTHIAVLHEDVSERLLTALRSVQRARLAYMFLAPKEAYAGTVQVPLEKQDAYEFDLSCLSDDQVSALFAPDSTVSARRTIESVRRRVDFPSHLPSGQMLVCGIATPLVLGEHWVLHPDTRHDDHTKAELFHGGAMVLAAGRPEVRQAELINPNGHLAAVPSILHADRFRTV